MPNSYCHIFMFSEPRNLGQIARLAYILNKMTSTSLLFTLNQNSNLSRNGCHMLSRIYSPIWSTFVGSYCTYLIYLVCVLYIVVCVLVFFFSFWHGVVNLFSTYEFRFPFGFYSSLFETEAQLHENIMSET